MPFVYMLHDTLALGATGGWILGFVALVWTIDCFIGFYLTLPVSVAQFWRRWKPAWLIKLRAGFYRLNFDLHRASGLWLWPLPFVFAWSSVRFNLPSVYEPVTSAVFDFQKPWEARMARTPRLNDSLRLDWRSALAAGERLMAEQSSSRGFAVERPTMIMLDRTRGVCTYLVKSSRDINDKHGMTYIDFDADTGALISLVPPTGKHSGYTIDHWLTALHTADVLGLPYRILVCVLRLVITMLSVTGVYIWWKKRKARVRRKSHHITEPESMAGAWAAQEGSTSAR